MSRSDSFSETSSRVGWIAWGALALGVLFNPWLVAIPLGLGPGEFQAQLAWSLVLIQVALVGFGALLLQGSAPRRAAAWFVAMFVIAGLLAALSGTSTGDRPAIRGLRTAEQPRHDPRLTERTLLKHTQTVDVERHAQLSSETRPVLHKTGTKTHHLTLEVSEGAVLVLSYGVDPLLSDHTNGFIEFFVTVRSAAGDPIRWKDSIELDGARIGSWQTHSLDLDSFAGSTVEVSLDKSHSGERSGAEYYDFVATDLAFWAQPILRSPSPGSRQLPNIVLISVDTLRADHLGFMGYSRDTSPVFDRAAAEGVVFRSCFSPASWTLPAHHSILSGMWPQRHGAVLFAPGNRLLGAMRNTSAAGIFRDAGYATAAFTDGGHVAGQYGFAEGFELYRESPRRSVVTVVESARQWVAEHGENPFFLFVHTYEPHTPYEDDYFVQAESLEAATEAVQKVARYDGDIRKADEYLGKLWEDLRRLSETRPTWVVLTSDHGEEFGDREGGDTTSCPADHGHTLYDELLHVPLVFEGLGVGGTVIDTPVRSVDILPTLLDYAGLPIPEGVDGRSLRFLMEGGTEPPRPVLAEALARGPDRAAVRTPEFKYIRRLSHGKYARLEKSCWKGTPDEELYDLASDPKEHRNLALDARRTADTRLQMETARGLFETLVSGRSLPPPLEVDPSVADTSQETMDRLRALGYIE